jgi:uncharacterized protein YaaN involved in tellurite resistance
MTDNATQLTPPAAAGALLTLTPPEPVPAVAPAMAGGMVPIAPAALPGLDAKVTAYVDSILAADVNTPAFSAKADDVRLMGDADIRGAAESANRLLSAPMRAMAKGDDTPGAKVASTLLALRNTIEGLDPSEATGFKKLLKFLPFGDKLDDYFHRYESSQKQLDAIICGLYAGADELRRDRAIPEGTPPIRRAPSSVR